MCVASASYWCGRTVYVRLESHTKQKNRGSTVTRYVLIYGQYESVRYSSIWKPVNAADAIMAWICFEALRSSTALRVSSCSFPSPLHCAGSVDCFLIFAVRAAVNIACARFCEVPLLKKKALIMPTEMVEMPFSYDGKFNGWLLRCPVT